MVFTVIIISLLLSAIFSGMEIAYISADRLRIELKKQKGSRRGVLLAKFYDNPAKFLGTMLVGNNIALVIFSTQMENILEPSLGISSVWLQLLAVTLITTIIVLIFGEFLPKMLFQLYANKILYLLTYPITLIRHILWPITWLMVSCSNTILRWIFKVDSKGDDHVFSRLDLENFIKNTRTNEGKEPIDTELFENALYLTKVKVRECMIPRTDIKDIEVNESVEELKDTFIETRLSKIIVYENDNDNILGYVHHQQMLHDPKDIRSLVLPIPVIPEAMSAHDLMNRFIKEHISMAYVVDEFGGVSGIITLEDILEEIFGEIEDEHDEEEHIESMINETEFRLAGRLEIDYINEKYNINLPEGDYHTIAGYILSLENTIPKKGRVLTTPDHIITIELVTDTKIELVHIKKITTQQSEEKAA